MNSYEDGKSYSYIMTLTCSSHGEMRYAYITFSWKVGMDHLAGVGIDRMIILKWILKEQNVKM
jgi:hypothetical protein